MHVTHAVAATTVSGRDKCCEGRPAGRRPEERGAVLVPSAELSGMEGISEWGSKGRDAVSHVNNLKKNILGKGNSKWKSPEVGENWLV